MEGLKIDTIVPKLSDDSVETAQVAESAGFDHVWVSETGNNPFLPMPLITDYTDDLTFGTRITMAFTRSPMNLAQTAWDLARYSDGRFILGLGTQVKGHIERRYSMEWYSPGPRLREIIQSLQHIWEVFQGEREELDYQGEYYSFSLMTEEFHPGPIDNPDIPIYVGGVNEFNIRLAGEYCDGLAMHSFNTPSYISDVIEPIVIDGLKRGNRPRDEIELSANPLIISGETREGIQEERERVRRRIAYYGSTRTYHDVLEHHGWEEIGPVLHDMSEDKRWDEMAELVTDEMIDTFAVEARYENLLDEVHRTYSGVCDRVMLSAEAGLPALRRA